ncbi:MAG: hypothetical protein SWK76_01305 [Actinomycetota bacterium]|nr:hypothetical protein [Actinomycetota bacterium]
MAVDYPIELENGDKGGGMRKALFKTVVFTVTFAVLLCGCGGGRGGPDWSSTAEGTGQRFFDARRERDLASLEETIDPASVEALRRIWGDRYETQMNKLFLGSQLPFSSRNAVTSVEGDTATVTMEMPDGYVMESYELARNEGRWYVELTELLASETATMCKQNQLAIASAISTYGSDNNDDYSLIANRVVGAGNPVTEYLHLSSGDIPTCPLNGQLYRIGPVPAGGGPPTVTCPANQPSHQL